MYSYKTQKTLAQKKKQAIRRLSQTGRTRTLSSSSKQGSKTEAPGVNPFFAALQTTAPVSSSSSGKNVFLEQQAVAASDDRVREDQSDTPEGVLAPNRPLSYAGAVKSTMNKPNVNPFVAAYSGPSGPASSHSGPASSQSLHLKRVPDHLNNKEFLWQHFEKFGPLRGIDCHPEKKFADIHFITQRGAILAKSHGKYLSDSAPPLSIFWFSDKTKGSGGAPVSHGLESVSAQPSPSTSPHNRPALSPATRGEGGAHMPSLTAAGITRKRIRSSQEEQEQEYVPTLFDVKYEQEEEREEEEGLDEGVPEGKDSVLSEEPLPDDESKMDTIARVPKHKYYLRSIYQPEKSSEGVKMSSSVERKVTPAVRVPPLADPRKGQSAIERFEVLDTRDKEIRKNIVKDTSLSAKAKVGCCPDMCPEKERYQREYQRRLSMFEIDNKINETDPGQGPRVNHSLAIKEYSRSAADKDEPLPHELRPLPVLIMTMDHIVTTIMDAGEGHVSEWYNFIWDRTRAITTDITYQQLSHSDCVHLIEQFARFHIMCSHILCEEELSVFDPKMNAETLSNHLQSLHQLYKDLYQEKGRTCKNEAEFCCYDILLHLMDGNVFNKVEQYNQSIRRSSEVQFAISVVQSVDSNNFVRFFKLVKRASYLSSCLLHSYFDLIRLRALKTLNQSHSSGKSNPMHFPLTDLTRMLQFGSEDEAADFCSYFGFNVIKDNKVQFQRGLQTEDYDPGAVKLRYDNHLLSSKDAEKSYGEIVYGGPLPPRPNHTPTCSFTGSGIPQQLAPKIDEEEITSMTTDVIDTVINEELKEISTNIIKQAQKDGLVSSISINALNQLMTEVLVSYCSEVSQQILTELMKERDIRDQEEFKAKLCLEISHEILANALRAESRLVATETITDAVLNYEALNGAVYSLVSELADSVCISMTRETVHECMVVARKERDDRLVGLRLQHERWRLKQYWIKWMRSLKRRRHIHVSINTFPSTGPLIPLSSQLNLLVKSPPNVSSSPKRRRLEQSSPLANLTREEFVSAINYSSLLPSGPHRTNIHWNLLLINGAATPPVGEELQLMWEWLVNKLGYVKQQNEGLENVCYTLPNNEVLKVSIKVLTVAQLTANINIINDELISTVLLYLPLVTSPQCYTEQVMGVANCVVRSLVPFAQVPLVILTPSPLHFLHQFHLSQEMESCNWPLFSKLLVHPLVENNEWKQNEQKLFNLVEWCLNSSPSLPPVQWMTGENYINEMINVNVVKPLLSDAQVRSASGLASQSPGVIVGLYNSVLDYLSQKILLKPSLTSLPITLIQSCSNTPPYWVPSQSDAIHKFQSILESLRLPRPQPHPPHGSLNDTSSSCMAYVQSVDDDFFLISRVKSLLLRESPTPWGHILLICIQHLLLCSSDAMSKVLVGVSRVRQEEAEFTPPVEWSSAVVDSLMATAGSREGDRQVSDNEGRGLRKRRFSDPSSHFSSSLRETKAVRLSLGGADPTPFDHMTGLNARLEYERTATVEFDEQLQRYLLEPDDIRGRRSDQNEQVEGGQSLSLHNKSLNECMDSLEDEIIKLRWREKLDRFSIIKNSF